MYEVIGKVVVIIGGVSLATLFLLWTLHCYHAAIVAKRIYKIEQTDSEQPFPWRLVGYWIKLCFSPSFDRMRSVGSNRYVYWPGKEPKVKEEDE